MLADGVLLWEHRLSQMENTFMDRGMGKVGAHSSLLVLTCPHWMDLSCWLFLRGKEADPVPTVKPRHLFQLLQTEFYWAHVGPSPVQIPCTAPTQGLLFQTTLRDFSILCKAVWNLLLLHSFICYEIIPRKTLLTIVLILQGLKFSWIMGWFGLERP